MNKYIVSFNDGAFYRTVKAKNEESALDKAIKQLSDGQKANYYNWTIEEI